MILNGSIQEYVLHTLIQSNGFSSSTAYESHLFFLDHPIINHLLSSLFFLSNILTWMSSFTLEQKRFAETVENVESKLRKKAIFVPTLDEDVKLQV